MSKKRRAGGLPEAGMQPAKQGKGCSAAAAAAHGQKCALGCKQQQQQQHPRPFLDGETAIHSPSLERKRKGQALGTGRMNNSCQQGLAVNLVNHMLPNLQRPPPSPQLPPTPQPAAAVADQGVVPEGTCWQRGVFKVGDAGLAT